MNVFKQKGKMKNNLVCDFQCTYSAPFTPASAFLCALVIQLSIIISMITTTEATIIRAPINASIDEN